MVSLIKRYAGVVGQFNTADYYAFSVVGTQAVTLDLSAAYGSPTLYLYNASGSQVGYSYVSTSGSVTQDATLAEVLAPGTYYAEISNSSTAPYSLSIYSGSPAIGSSSTLTGGTTLAQATSLGTLGGSANPVIGYVGGTANYQYYAFKIGTTSNVSMLLSGLQNSADMFLLNAAGDTLASFYAGSTNEIAATDILPSLVAGSYYIEIEGFSYEPTGYNLALAATAVPVSGGTTEPTAQSLGTLTATAQTITGSVNQVNTSAYYSFSVGSSSRVSLSLSGVSQTAGLTLYDASNSLLLGTYYARPTNSVYATWDLQPLSAGSYYIRVSNSYDATNFTLTAAATSLSTNTTVATAARLTPTASAQSVSGLIDDNVGSNFTSSSYYTFTLATAATIDLRLVANGGAIDQNVVTGAQLKLLNSSGSTTITTSYATASGQDALITDNLAAGTYYVDVSQYGYTTPFTLTYSTGAPLVGTATSNAAGTTLATARSIGALTATPASYADWVGSTDKDDYYKFTLNSASTVYFDLTGLTSGVSFYLQNVSGSNIDSRSGGAINGGSLVDTLAAGTYYLDVQDDYNAGTGYNLSGYALAVPAAAYTSFGTPDNLGTLGTTTLTVTGYVGSVQPNVYYEFNVTGTSAITAAMSNTAFSGGSFQLLNISGDSIQTSTQSSYSTGGSLIWDVGAGTYFIKVSYSSSTDYTLSLNATPIADAAGTTLSTAYSAGTIGGIVHNDFFGSGTSDVLFQNTQSGLVLNWQMSNGGLVAGDIIAGAAAGWGYVGTGDFYGNGTADILFQNSQSGLVLDWEMSNGALIGGDPIAGASSDWKLIGTGDFNGDGTSDILFQNASGLVLDWQISNGALVGGTPIAGASSDWKFIGTGDFFGTGTDDILFQNSQSGLILDWEMSNGQLVGGDAIAGASPGWNYVGVGDFTGNGTDDILFQNASSGQLLYWEIANGTLVTGVAIGALAAGQSVVGIGDYTGNGTSDILVETAGTGLITDWVMANGQLSQKIDVGGAAAGWKVLG